MKIFSFKKLPIKHKLIITILGISTIMLLSTLSVFITSELLSLKKTMLEDLSTLTELVGKNSSAAILFYDQKVARENLLALKAKPHIESAHLYSDDRLLFAEYHRADHQHITPQAHRLPDKIYTLIQQKKEGYYYINDQIHMLKKIILEVDNDLIGFIHIESDRKVYWQRVTQYIYTIIATLIIALLLTLLFAYRVQKIFTDPLLKLLTSMQHVTSQHNYTMTIDNHHDDEFGELIDGYNKMLNQLEEHKQITQNYQANLEKRVSERTQQLKKVRDEAISASRLKTIFLANMSHEIRTPMNAILGYTQLLQLSKLDHEQARKLGIIDKSGNHLLSLINDILELSKIEAGSLIISKSDFDLLELIHSVENMFKIRCDQKNIIWKMTCFSNTPIPVNGDQGKLRQILINLLGNACKFTDQGGVSFTIENPAENHYKFSIADTGTGIDKEAMSRIFDAFHQEKQGIIKGGTGLGLNITKRYVELISGDLQVSSTIGQGSVFYFDIELLPARSTFTPNEVEPASYILATDRPLSALVVDDNKDNTELLSNILSQLGFTVVSAENGQQGVAEIEKNMPDIVFMDIRMPVMDGLEAIKKIRQTYSSVQLKCVAISASTLQHSSEHYIKSGFDLFISKPFRFDEILLAVKELLRVELQLQSDKTTAHTDNIEMTLTDMTLADKTAGELILDKELTQKLLQAAEYSQLTELKKLLTELNQYGNEGKRVASHLEMLINTADLDGISDYVKGIINE